MNSIGNKIQEIRKSKGLTQEELAELSKVNLRTIQRVENNENEPRGKTINLICDVLEINSYDFFENEKQIQNGKKISSLLINGFFLILLNLLLMSIIGYLTLDSNANTNSVVGALLLSFFIPFFIVYLTPKMKALERMLKFGIGYISYIFMLIIAHGIQSGFRTGIKTGLFLCLIICIGVLYYGNVFLKHEK